MDTRFIALASTVQVLNPRPPIGEGKHQEVQWILVRKRLPANVIVCLILVMAKQLSSHDMTPHTVLNKVGFNVASGGSITLFRVIYSTLSMFGRKRLQSIIGQYSTFYI